MSKLAYSGEVDNGTEGWQENFGDILVDSEPVSQLPEQVEESNNSGEAAENINFEEQQAVPVAYNEEPPASLAESSQWTGPPVVENTVPFTEPPPVASEQVLEVNQNAPPAETSSEPASVAPSNEEVPPPPPLFMSPPEPSAQSSLTAFIPEPTTSVPVEESQAFTALPPPPAPSSIAPLTFSAVSTQAPKPDLTKMPAATMRSTAAPSAVQSPPSTLTPSGPQAGSEQISGTRKPLMFPQAQIKYRQPMDYTALLNNAAARATAVTRVNQGPTIGTVPGVVKQSQPTLPFVSNVNTATTNQLTAAAAVLAAQQRHQTVQQPAKVNPNMMSYPPPQSNRAPVVAAPTAAKPVEHPVQQQVGLVNQQQQPRQHPVANLQNFPKSQTMPDIPSDTQSQQQQQQQQQQQYYQQQPGTNGEVYLSEQEDPAAKAVRASGGEERRSKKHHHHRSSRRSNFPAYQQPPPMDPYQMSGYFTENPQNYADYYQQWYAQQARLYGSYSGTCTPTASYDESGSEYDGGGGGSHSRPSSRMSVGAYVSPQVGPNPYAAAYMQQAQVQAQTGTPGGYDQAAAWWYWYYMQQQQMMQQPQAAPQRPSTPKKFAYPHCRATFSSSGFLVVVLPGRNAYAGASGPGSSANRVNIMRTFDALSPVLPEIKEFSDFPGPLVPSDSHKIDVINFAQHMSQQALASDYIDRDSVNLLWRFIELLVRQNGTYFGADVSHLLTDMVPALPEQLVAPADQAVQAPAGSIQKLRDLLLHGRKREAVDFAMSQNLWAHAMFLSHSISEQYFLAVRNRFLAASAAPGDPLATFYQLATLSSPVISRQAVTSDMHSWRQHLAVILSNAAVSAQFQRQLLLSLGDTLRSQSRLYAAQLCYLMAGDQFSTFPPASTLPDGFSPGTRMILLGTEPYADFLRLAKPYFCQLTEIYEYCLRLANPRAVLPAFQLFKAFYCLCLAEFGLVHEAFRYLISLIESLQISFTIYPTMANSFPRVCFKWLCDLYTALHKSEPAVDYNTIDWIFVAARGGPIQPPQLFSNQTQNQQAMQPQQQQQQQQNYLYGGGSGSRPDEFRNTTQTPGPLGASTQSQGSGIGGQSFQYNQSGSSLHGQQVPAPPSQQPQQQQHQQNQQEPAPQYHHQQQPPQQQQGDLPFAKSYGGSALPGGQNKPQNVQANQPGSEQLPFAQSGRFQGSMSRRSDGGSSDQPGFGSSVESLTSLNNMMSDMRKAALNYAQNQETRTNTTTTSLPDQVHQKPVQPEQQQPQQQFQPEDASNQNQNQSDQQFVSPLSSWQPLMVSSAPPPPGQTQQPLSDYNRSSSNQSNRQQDYDNRDVGPTPPPSSSSQNDKSPKKDDTNKSGTPSGGLFASMFGKIVGNSSSSSGKPAPKKMILPDDNKPTMIYDKDKGRWVDTSAKDGDAAVADDLPPPPPPMMPTQAPPTMPGPGGMGGFPTLPTMSIQQRPRGRYVDVFKPASSPENGPGSGANSLLRPPLFPQTQQTARMFVPPPVPDSS